MASSLWQGGFNHEGLDAKGKMINPTEAFAGIGGTSGASMIVLAQLPEAQAQPSQEATFGKAQRQD